MGIPVQLKDILHQHGHTVRDLYEAMYLRGHDVTYKDVTRYGRCCKRDNKPRWDQILTCLKEDFGIKLPW
jgi:hypothetical protein